MTKVWKILCRENGDLKSMAVSLITYIPGQRTLPIPGSALFAWDNRFTAIRLASLWDDSEAWVAEAEVLGPMRTILPTYKVYALGQAFNEFWEKKLWQDESNVKKYDLMRGEYGTLACAWIELKERIA
jgi:hypothetical protein